MITVLYTHSILSGDKPHFLPIVRLMAKIALLHLFVTSRMCSFQLSLLSMVTPRYLTDVERAMLVEFMFMLFGCFWFRDLVQSTTFVFRALIFSPLVSHHEIISFMFFVACSNIVDMSMPVSRSRKSSANACRLVFFVKDD